MDPISLGTMATISMVSSAAAGGVGALGALTKGQSEANMYKYQSGVAGINQQLALQNAAYSQKVGEVKAQQIGMKGRYEAGQITTQQAASGLDVTRGTTAKVREGQEAITRYDEQTARADAARKAYGYETEASKEEAQSKMYKQAAKGAETGSYLSALGSVLGGGASVSDKWLTYKQKGFFGAEA
jgi:hypothetical protein